ncbi:MAG: prepilin peptidase [Betaproteobacteria bacterium HGW-Betaproteobacteria-8]|nr:MAG: prepilin peptidase [Betaproteobacteria bacterium HGW-Betaproteobacteria-8]
MGLLALMPLGLLLLIIAQEDIRSHRISNRLVLVGMLLGIALNGLLPAGLGFNSVVPGGLGWLSALQGLGLGLVVLLPLYLLRTMGAGDVKLMGMVGSFLGPGDILGALLAILLTGGLLALIIVLSGKQLTLLMHNMKFIAMDGMLKLNMREMPVIDGWFDSVGKLPYAFAITTGTLAFLLWQRLGQ